MRLEWNSFYSESYYVVVPLLVLLSFFFINTGTSASLVSIKAFLSVSMIVGNFIDVYLFGLIAVLMN
jgi:hypothetical protein